MKLTTILLYLFAIALVFMVAIIEYAMLENSDEHNIIWRLITFCLSIALVILTVTNIVTKIVVSILVGGK